MKLIILVVFLLLLTPVVFADTLFFTYFDENVYTASTLFLQNSPKKEQVFDKQEIKLDPFVIEISEKGLNPQEAVVQAGQNVIWVNNQERLKSLIKGVREISDLNTGYILPGEIFTWEFTSSGEFTYVDAVVIGRVGKITVK